MSIKTIFLDRDGIINKDKNYLYKIDDFEFIEGVFESCKYFQDLGYEIIIVTNQSGITRGYYSLQEYEILTRWMLNQFKSREINILDVFYCPHGPNDKCKCRKPRPGMFIAAKNKYNIDMKDSWMIGDRERDITAASLAGIKNTIIVKSSHQIDEENSQAKYQLSSIKDVRNSILF